MSIDYLDLEIHSIESMADLIQLHTSSDLFWAAIHQFQYLMNQKN